MATSQKVSVTKTPPPTEEGCNHHWDIDTPSGGSTSLGRCRFCREIREFRNAMPQFDKRGEREYN